MGCTFLGKTVSLTPSHPQMTEVICELFRLYRFSPSTLACSFLTVYLWAVILMRLSECSFWYQCETHLAAIFLALGSLQSFHPSLRWGSCFVDTSIVLYFLNQCNQWLDTSTLILFPFPFLSLPFSSSSLFLSLHIVFWKFHIYKISGLIYSPLPPSSSPHPTPNKSSISLAT